MKPIEMNKIVQIVLVSLLLCIAFRPIEGQQQYNELRLRRPTLSKPIVSENPGDIQASSVAASSASSQQPTLNLRPPGPATNVKNKPPKVDAASDKDSPRDEDQESQNQPATNPKRPMPNNRRRPNGPKRQPPPVDRYQDHYDDEDCYTDDSDDYDYRNMFHQMAAQPMRHVSRMIGRMFDNIAPMNFGSGHDYDGAMASAYSNSEDGVSRLSSAVTNNGRTRGIMSETRNGRTKTERFGDDGDETLGYDDD